MIKTEKKLQKNIIVVKMSAIGDVIHALPVSYALKETFPDAKVTWVVEKAAYELLTNNPYIDKVLLFEKHKFRSIGGLIKNLPSFAYELKQGQYNVSLDLQGLAKSASVAYLSGAKTRLGFCNMRELSSLVSRPVCGTNVKGHVVERYLDVVRELGCRVEKVIFPLVTTAQEEQVATAIAKQSGLDLNNPYIILATGANWPNKRWPASNYAHLVDKIYEKDFIPVLIGGPGDRMLADQIIAGTQVPPVDLTGKTSLKQLAYVIKRAKALVGGDTGPMHLSAGIGTPVVALLGPTDINRNGPYGQGHVSLSVSYDCHGCWKRKCPKNVDCLADITIDQVYQGLNKIVKWE